MFVHSPQVTEIGGFGYGDAGAALVATEPLIRSRWAWATTTHSGMRELEAAGWTSLGHRYNQYHGPNFVRMWCKDFGPAQPGAVKKGQYGAYCVSQKTGPWGAYSCGVWFDQTPFGESKILSSPWLGLWELPSPPDDAQRKALLANEWKELCPTLWHNCQPLSDKNKRGSLEQMGRR
jgi:hypothetical protein